MKRFHSLLILFAALLPLSVTAQTSTDLNEGSILTHDAVNDIYVFAWWGKTGRTYFIQQSDNLTEWNYLPEIESGLAAVIQYGMSTNEDKIFARLRHTDRFTTHPETDDFDGDGISNIDEITMSPVQGNPLDASSNDGDSIPDDWEMFYGLDTTPGVDDSNDDGDADGLTNAGEYAVGTNPNWRDHPDLALILNF
jgi:hypothetical protein